MARTEKKVALVALEPIQHDGVRFEPNATLETTPEQADALIAMGAARLASEPPPAPPES